MLFQRPVTRSFIPADYSRLQTVRWREGGLPQGEAEERDPGEEVRQEPSPVPLSVLFKCQKPFSGLSHGLFLKVKKVAQQFHF